MINKKRGLGVGMLAVFAFALIVVLIYSFSITEEVTITGEVVFEEEVVVCTLDYSPVCGIDEETYSNLCVMESAGVDLLHEGVCVYADIVYFNGSIVANGGMLPDHIDGIALRDEVVVFLGSQSEVLVFAGEGTVLRDLQGDFLLIDFVQGSFIEVKSVSVVDEDYIKEKRKAFGETGVIEVKINVGGFLSDGKY